MFAIYRSPEATSFLRQTWETADDDFRRAILQASHRIDRMLHKNPQQRGESRGGRTRILIHAPLAVTFEIDEPLQLVRILRAWVCSPGTDGQRRCG